jgi:hypothetical protein
MDEKVQERRKAQDKVKRNYQIKIATAKKKEDGDQQVIELEANKAKDIKKITEEFADKISQGKSEIKEKYNVKAR